MPEFCVGFARAVWVFRFRVEIWVEMPLKDPIVPAVFWGDLLCVDGSIGFGRP